MRTRETSLPERRIFCIPGAKKLTELWQGHVHMHTAFWIAWVCPLAIYIQAQQALQLSMVAELPMLAYLVVSTVGTWRSTWHPPGSSWAPKIYQTLLFMFTITAVTGIAFATFNLAMPNMN